MNEHLLVWLAFHSSLPILQWCLKTTSTAGILRFPTASTWSWSILTLFRVCIALHWFAPLSACLSNHFWVCDWYSVSDPWGQALHFKYMTYNKNLLVSARTLPFSEAILLFSFSTDHSFFTRYGQTWVSVAEYVEASSVSALPGRWINRRHAELAAKG